MRLSAVGVLALITASATATVTACVPSGQPLSGPTTTITPPSIAQAALSDDRQGATNFASHWLDLMAYAHRTLDSAPLRPLGLPSCQTCDQFEAQLDKDREAGYHYDGGGIHFLSADPTDFTQGSSAVVNVQFDEGEIKVTDRGGKVVDMVPAGETIFQFSLRWTQSGWRAAAVKLAQVDNSGATAVHAPGG